MPDELGDGAPWPAGSSSSEGGYSSEDVAGPLRREDCETSERRNTEDREAPDREGLAEEAVDAEVECPVCMKLLVDATSTPCGHTFCKLCLEEAFMRKAACPLCRLQINEKECKDDRILRKMIEKLYPETSRRRREELLRCVEDDDHEHWQRKVDTIKEALREGQGEPEEGNQTYVVWQNPSFSLPVPGEEEDIYFENPQFTSLVDYIYRTSLCGFVLVPGNRKHLCYCQQPEAVGVLIRVAYYTLLSPSTVLNEVREEWVPPRLKLQRARFKDNKIELHPSTRQSCVVKGKCLGRVRIRSIVCTTPGDCKGICQASATPICEINTPQRADSVRLKALALRNQILALSNDIGQAGRLLYNRRFGDLAAVPSRCGISQLEDISFAFMIPLAIPPKQRNTLICSSSTDERLESLLRLIRKSGTSLIRMGLTQSNNGEWLSRIFLGGWNQSIVLFVILILGIGIMRVSDNYYRRL